jgi:hypothetical protein
VTIRSIINITIKFILEDVTEENHEEYKKSQKRLIQKWYRHSKEVTLEILLKRPKNTIITDSA